jgi:hypothetical protein
MYTSKESEILLPHILQIFITSKNISDLMLRPEEI